MKEIRCLREKPGNEAKPSCVLYNFAVFFVSQLGQTVLHQASFHGYTDHVRRLLSGGAQVNVQDKVSPRAY